MSTVAPVPDEIKRDVEKMFRIIYFSVSANNFRETALDLKAMQS